MHPGIVSVESGLVSRSTKILPEFFWCVLITGITMLSEMYKKQRYVFYLVDSKQTKKKKKLLKGKGGWLAGEFSWLQTQPPPPPPYPFCCVKLFIYSPTINEWFLCYNNRWYTNKHTKQTVLDLLIDRIFLFLPLTYNNSLFNELVCLLLLVVCLC